MRDVAGAAHDTWGWEPLSWEVLLHDAVWDAPAGSAADLVTAEPRPPRGNKDLTQDAWEREEAGNSTQDVVRNA